MARKEARGKRIMRKLHNDAGVAGYIAAQQAKNRLAARRNAKNADLPAY
jgi:hypothetical protein